MSEKNQAVDGVRLPQTFGLTRRQYQSPRLRTFGKVHHLTQGSLANGNDAGAGKKNVSDCRLKESIVQIGRHPLGIGLYLFDYKPEFRDACGHGRQFGVMAQEVETVLPEAVSVHPNGYKQVDYGMLGIERVVH